MKMTVFNVSDIFGSITKNNNIIYILNPWSVKTAKQ